MPSSLQAANGSATPQYLNAVKTIGTNDHGKVLAYLRKQKLNDLYAKNGAIRDDGRLMQQQHLYPVKVSDPLHNSLRSVISQIRAVCCVVFLVNSRAIDKKKRLSPHPNPTATDSPELCRESLGECKSA